MPVKMDEWEKGTVVDVIGSRVLVTSSHPLRSDALIPLQIEKLSLFHSMELMGLIRLYAGGR